MAQLIAQVSAAAGLFVGTNLDDILVLTVLFLTSRVSGAPRVWQIWLGQYIGLAALVAASAIAALGLSAVPEAWIGLLGLVPIALGIRGLVHALRSESEETSPVARGLGSVIAVTIANGSDNLSVYTPVFRINSAEANGVALAVFVILAAAWCLAGAWLGSHPRVIGLIERFGDWLVPAVFIAIGAVIVVEAGVIDLLS